MSPVKMIAGLRGDRCLCGTWKYSVSTPFGTTRTLVWVDISVTNLASRWVVTITHAALLQIVCSSCRRQRASLRYKTEKGKDTNPEYCDHLFESTSTKSISIGMSFSGSIYCIIEEEYTKMRS